MPRASGMCKQRISVAPGLAFPHSKGHLMPARPLVRMVGMLQRMSSHLLLVSPVQCAAYAPLPRNVDLNRYQSLLGDVLQQLLLDRTEGITPGVPAPGTVIIMWHAAMTAAHNN